MQRIGYKRFKVELQRKLRRIRPLSAERIVIFMLILSIIMLCVTVYRKAIPLAGMSAETVAKGEIEKIVLDAAKRAIENSNEKLYFRENDVNGSLTFVEANSKEISMLCSNVIRYIDEAVTSKKYIKIKVPIGNVIGGSYFHGTGPCISVRAVPYVAAYADIESKFSDAGVNQTLYSVVLTVNTDVTLVCADENIDFSTETKITVSEEIIVGDVPGGYFR